MKLLKTGFVAICIMSLAASCASYKTCPAYAERSQQEIYNPDFQSQPTANAKVRNQNQ